MLDSTEVPETETGATVPAEAADGKAGSRPRSADPFDPEVFNALVHGGALPQIR